MVTVKSLLGAIIFVGATSVASASTAVIDFGSKECSAMGGGYSTGVTGEGTKMHYTVTPSGAVHAGCHGSNEMPPTDTVQEKIQVDDCTIELDEGTAKGRGHFVATSDGSRFNLICHGFLDDTDSSRDDSNI